MHFTFIANLVICPVEMFRLCLHARTHKLHSYSVDLNCDRRNAETIVIRGRKDVTSMQKWNVKFNNESSTSQRRHCNKKSSWCVTNQGTHDLAQFQLLKYLDGFIQYCGSLTSFFKKSLRRKKSIYSRFSAHTWSPICNDIALIRIALGWPLVTSTYVRHAHFPRILIW